MSNQRPTRAEISISALQHNLKIVKQSAGDAKVMAVVKAEAYGHGLIRTSQEFVRGGVDYLGVSFLEEGILLRKAGIEAPVLVMGGLVDEQIESYLKNDLDLTISSVYKAKKTDKIAGGKGLKARAQLKIDTGMGRVGQHWMSAEKLFREVAKLRNIEISGLYTHLAVSDLDNFEFTLQQLLRFDKSVNTARQCGIDPPNIHVANSGAVIRMNGRVSYNMIRPGLMLYGYSPNPRLEGIIDLKPAMTLRTEVVYVKFPPQGTTIGYDSTWRSPGNRWIATLPVGYGDGYPRRLGNLGWVMLRGRPCPIVGRVSMDQITIDAGDEAYLRDEAILFGGTGENRLPLWDICQTMDAIPYELLCGLTARVPRVYI